MRCLFFVLLILIPCGAYAIEPSPQQLVIDTHDVLRGHFFEERNLKGFNAPLKTEGHFVVAPAHGLIWKIEKPLPTATIITPSGLVQTIAGTKVMFLPAKKVPFLLHLYDMLGGALAGNWKPLEAEFAITKSEHAGSWEITLVPRRKDNPAMPFSSITVDGHRFVENVTFLKTDGDSDTLAFDEEILSSAPPLASENTAFNSVHP
jgi:hypothetical protein